MTVVKVLLKQMGWYSLLRVCPAGPCTCTICLAMTESGCPALAPSSTYLLKILVGQEVVHKAWRSDKAPLW